MITARLIQVFDINFWDVTKATKVAKKEKLVAKNLKFQELRKAITLEYYSYAHG